MIAAIPIAVQGVTEHPNYDGLPLIELLHGFHLVWHMDEEDGGLVFDDILYITDNKDTSYSLLVYLTRSFAVVGVPDDSSRLVYRVALGDTEGSGENDGDKNGNTSGEITGIAYFVPYVAVKHSYVMRMAFSTAYVLGTLADGLPVSGPYTNAVLAPVFLEEGKHEDIQRLNSYLKLMPAFARVGMMDGAS